MAIEFIKQISHFKTVKVPIYINVKIQECALNHLNLKDMGQLRDRMEGQMYYNKLRSNIMSEFALENILFKTSFDWDKRMDKSYKRKPYSIEDFKVHLITFNTNNFPKISVAHTNLCIMANATEDSKVYLSGLATKELIKSSGLNIRNDIFEMKSFDKLIPFSTQEDLIEVLNKTV
ncbi:hypothetical protein FF125_16925 [Aureibaculum algae]|uniref:Uncharacterized protein n=1 Tax=Aureibaculum algae TaxID=2584122 RepID=A0A5B7TXL4_9FLAO|nr:hypothetical protein [Aureibaculum algae]QCX40044.1 hypothetical protein FF125_16925 [Aureibaculum algae]